MTEHEDAIQNILRSSEEAKHVLEAVIVPSKPMAEEIKSASLASMGLSSAADDSGRILALVNHKNSKYGLEEGCLFVFKYRSHTLTKVLEIQCVFPITSDFSISISIAHQQPEAPAASATASEQPRTGLNLTITPGLEQDGESLTVLTYDVHRLRSILAECKRLKELHDRVNHTTIKTHLWVAAYLTQRHWFSKLSSSPLDLRVTHQPLYTRLLPSSAGFPGDEPENIRLVRDDWVRRSAWTACVNASVQPKEMLCLHLGTFNVNGKVPSQDLSPWVASLPASHILQPDKEELIEQLNIDTKTPDNSSPSRSLSPLRNFFQYVIPKTLVSAKSCTDGAPNLENENCYREPDILVFAFQELDLSAETLLYSTSTAKEDAWCSALFAALGERAILYEKLASKQMVGVLLVVIVKKSLKPCFHDVKTTSAGVGILGVMGNKGGVALRVKFSPFPTPEVPSPCSTTLTFVNSHLAAFDEMADKRNADFHELSSRLYFGSEVDPDDASSYIYETDALFWMGDLNYRIDLPDADIRNILASDGEHKLETLLSYDQLKNAISAGKAFTIFSEHPITHLPTYRFSTAALTDDLGYDVKRKPAWTDRILHAGGPLAKITQVSYLGHPEITSSDHRPVSANFNILLPSLDQTQFDDATRKFGQLVSELEHSEEHPIMRIDSKILDLGKVSYKHLVSRTVNLQNVGKVPCVYYFVPAEPGGPIHPPWLSIDPMVGLLLPEETASIKLSAYVDNNSAPELNGSLTRILDITLILHTARGQDYFITVIGEYNLTCFSNKLTGLTSLPGPISSVKTSEDLLPEGRAVNAPREIVRLVQWLMSNAAEVVGLFSSPAEAELVDTIRECLDTGDEFPFKPPYSRKISLAFGDTLLQFLESLTEPVVPPSIHARCTEVNSRDEAFELLDAFPSVSVNVWISITAFLHFICLQVPPPQSHTDVAEALASIFSPVLLRDDSRKTYTPVSPLGKRKFLLYFIT